MKVKAHEWGSNGGSNAITQILSENILALERRMKRLVHMNEKTFISLMNGYFREDSVYHQANIYQSKLCNIPEDLLIQEHRVLTSNFGCYIQCLENRLF